MVGVSFTIAATSLKYQDSSTGVTPVRSVSRGNFIRKFALIKNWFV